MGHNRLLKVKFSGLSFRLLLVGIWSLLACQLPGLVAQSFDQATPTVTNTEYPGPAASPAYPEPDATPTGVTTSAPYPQLSAVVPFETDTGLGYPPVATLQPGYPYLEPGVIETSSPYPEPQLTQTATLSAPVSAASPTPSPTTTLQRTGTVARTQTATRTTSRAPSVTPSSVAVRSLTPTASRTTVRTATAVMAQVCDPSYPDFCIPPNLTIDLDCEDIAHRNFRVLPPDPHQFDDGGVPGIGCEDNLSRNTQDPYPSPYAGPYPAALNGTQFPTSTIAPGSEYPGPGTTQPTLTSPPGAGTFTPTSTLVFQPSPTFVTPTPVYAIPATPTPVRYQTPTPTRTPTPTVTPTRRPAPPWISSQLRATDPRTVRLASGKVQLIMFFAFWSGPSQAMAPVVHHLQAEYGGQMNFIYLDIDDPATDTLQQQLGYRFEPHFFLLDAQGKIIQQWVGYVSYETFVQAIEAALP